MKISKQAMLVRYQQGSVLLWGLVILLVLTVIGVAAARMGTTDIRIAGNQMYEMATYQEADSMLERVIDLAYIKETAEAENHQQSWSFPEDFEVQQNSAAVIPAGSTGTMAMGSSVMCTGQEGVAMSAEMNPAKGAVGCRLFTVESRARIAGSGMRSQHTQGVLKYLPPTGDSLPDGS